MFGIEGLTPEIFLVFAIICLTVILFITEIVRVDVVAFLVLVLLGITGLVPSDDLFKGFASDAVISLIGIMIMGAGLEHSGVVNKITSWILRIGDAKEKRIMMLLMGSAGFLSGFLRSVGTVALFLPVITRIRRQTGIAKARLLLPLGFCAILGSTLTMIGTGPLILLNSLLVSLGAMKDVNGEPQEPFGLFFVLPIGLTLLFMGMLYFFVLGRFFLPNIPVKPVQKNGTMDYFRRTYGIGGEFIELKVPHGSILAGNTLIQWEALLDPEIAIIGIKTPKVVEVPPLRKTEIPALSIVAALGPKDKIKDFADKYGLKVSSTFKVFKTYFTPTEAGLCEAVVPPSSQLVGIDFKELCMRRKFSTQVLAVHRGSKTRRGAELQDLNLRAGDTLGMLCNWRVLSKFERNPDFAVVTTDYPREKYEYEKANVALFFSLITILFLAFTNISAPICLLMGAVGMISFGVLSIDDAYSAVSWKTVFLMAGLIPLGVAVQSTGAASWIASHFLRVFEGIPVWGIEIALAVIASFFSLIMSNVGATVLLVPMAVQIAITTGVDPRLFAIIVAISTSNSFLIPTHQANALISGPGKFKVIDFLKSGILISVIYILVVLVGLNLKF